MIRRLLWVLLALVAAAPAHATTARDLSARMRVDGFTDDFTDDEKVFGFIAGTDEPEEPADDSKWGVNEDLNQIRVTWDAKYLYLAGEGRIWDNNMILFIDSVPRVGLGAMDSLNSWRRNFFFDTTGVSSGNGFAADLFVATWDGNTSPRLIMQESNQRVRDLETSTGFFSAAATFDKGNTGRAMEIALPWRSVFLGPVGGPGVKDTVVFVNGVPDTIPVFPAGSRLRIIGAVTAGADGTGGPDCAPDNTRGLTTNSGDAVYLDNWATIDIDRNDDTGRGHGGPDGVADWNVDPHSRVSFRITPSLNPPSLRFRIDELRPDRPAIRPEAGDQLRFTIGIAPKPDPANPYHQVSSLQFSANVFDLEGRIVRTLLRTQSMRILDVPQTEVAWDGRDDQGAIVPPGVYILRAVLEPNLSRGLRSVVVVR